MCIAHIINNNKKKLFKLNNDNKLLNNMEKVVYSII